MYLALIIAPINITLVIVGIHTPMKGAAIGLATAITQGINAIILICLLRKMWGPMGLSRVFRTLLRTLFASAACAGVILAVQEYAPQILGDQVPLWVRRISVLSASIIFGGTIYLMLSKVLGATEVSDLLGKKRREASH